MSDFIFSSSATQKNNYITIKSHRGNYLNFEPIEVGKNNQTSTKDVGKKVKDIQFLVSTSEHVVALLLEKQNGAEYHFRDASSGYYITVENDSGRLLAVEKPDKIQHFVFVQQPESKQHFAIKVSGGKKFLSEDEGGRLSVSSADIGTSELFIVNNLKVLKGHSHDGHHGCCGPEISTLKGQVATSDGILWHDKSHEGIIHKTIALLAAFSPQREDIEQFLDIWRNIPKSPKYEFGAGQVFQGLHDADYKEKYIDRPFPVGPGSFRTHFYNPKSRRNYLEKWWNPAIFIIKRRLAAREIGPIPEHLLDHVTALTEGQRYFNLAVHHGRRVVRYGANRSMEDMQKLGYNLGLSLHFLTDLTQPMHADNFTAVDIWGTWFLNFHGYFEELVDKFPNGGSWKDSLAGRALSNATITQGDLTFWQDNNHTSFGVLLHLLALSSQPLLPTLGSYPLDEQLVRKFLADTIQKAPNWVARMFMAFMYCANQPLGLSDKKWYSITEITHGHYLCAKPENERFLGCAPAQNVKEEKRLFCLIFNPDGTCSFVLKSDPRKLWTNNMSREIFELRVESSGKRETSFRLIPSLHGNRWIYFDYSVDTSNALTVGWGNWDKYIVGDVPIHGLYGGAGGYHHTSQLFKFDAGRDMTEAEQQRVKSAHPIHGMYEWWGAKK